MFFPIQVRATFAQPPCKRMKKPSAPVSAEYLISVAPSYLHKEDDEFLVMAKGYAAKMKKLTPDQLIFADRVITETLVEAQMGKLTRWTSLSTNTSPVLSMGTSSALSTTKCFREYSQSLNSTVQSNSLNTTQNPANAKNLLQNCSYEESDVTSTNN
jgi:hypothetical protein